MVDISNPNSPSIIGSIDTPGTAKGVDVSPELSIAVVADGSSGIQVVDITDPTHPAIMGGVSTGVDGDARDIVVNGDFAFVADLSQSFTVVDISDPVNPVVVASTPLNLGGRLQDVALSGRFGFGADVFFVNEVPIIDVSDPENPIWRNRLDFTSFREDDGTGIAVDSNFVYLTAEFGTFTENGTTGNTRLYIGQYLALEDTAGIPPTVTITSPASGDKVIEGVKLPITVQASDDVTVVAVNFLVDGNVVSTDTTAPYQFTLNVPVGITSLTLGATASDPGGNLGTAQDVVVNVIPDPLTTVVGRVVDLEGNPLSGAAVTCVGVTGTTGSDGTFSIPGVPTAQGTIQCTFTFTGTDGKTLRGASAIVPPVIGGITDMGQIVAAEAGPTIVESGWSLTRVVSFADGQAAHYNPIDGRLYVGRRGTGSTDGLYRINAGGSPTKLADGSNVAVVVVDHDDSDLFLSEDFGGSIFRVGFGETGRTTWVSGFHAGDDDPIGMAIAPNNYTGSVLLPGEALVVDRGFNGPDEIWRFSPDTAEGETLVHADNSTLINAVDITIGRNDVYVVDTGEEGAGNTPGRIYRVEVGGALTLVVTSEAILDPLGIATDPTTGDLFVLDAVGDRLVRVNPQTGVVSTVFTGFAIPGDGWAGVDVKPDGTQIFITDGADAIFTFSR